MAARPHRRAAPGTRGSFERYDGGAYNRAEATSGARARRPEPTSGARARLRKPTRALALAAGELSAVALADLANIYDAARDRHERVSYKRDDRVKSLKSARPRRTERGGAPGSGARSARRCATSGATRMGRPSTRTHRIRWLFRRPRHALPRPYAPRPRSASRAPGPCAGPPPWRT